MVLGASFPIAVNTEKGKLALSSPPTSASCLSGSSENSE